MPLRFMAVYIAMMPRLKAEENLEAYEVAAMGAGSFTKSYSRQVLRRWQADAELKKTKRKMSKEEYKIVMASRGMKVR